MKKLVLLLALVLCCGCANPVDKWTQEYQAAETAAQATMKFEVGDLVGIKLGGLGMVVDRSGFDRTYCVRTGPNVNYELQTFYAFELEMP